MPRTENRPFFINDPSASNHRRSDASNSNHTSNSTGNTRRVNAGSIQDTFEELTYYGLSTNDIHKMYDSGVKLADKSYALSLEVIGTLDSYAKWNSAPSLISSRSSNTNNAHSFNGSLAGVGGGGGIYVPGAAGSIDYGANAMRGGVGGRAGFTDNSGRYYGASGFMTLSGFYSIGGNYAGDTLWGSPFNIGGSFAANNKLSFARLSFFGSLGIGPISAAAGLSVAVTGDSVVKFIKSYTGDDEDLQGKVLLRSIKTLGSSMRVAGGAAYSGVGIGARLEVSKNNTIEVEQWVNKEEYDKVVRKPKGFEEILRKKVRLYGALAKDEEAAMPELNDPLNLPKGFLFRTTTTGTISGGVVITAFETVRIGYVASMKGVFTLSVRKIDENHIEVYTAPLKIKGDSVYVDIPGIGKISCDRIDEIASEQSWCFDLKKPTAKAAYLACLHGEFPSNLRFRQLKVSQSNYIDREDMAAAWANEKLPDGVVRTALSRARIKKTRKGFEAGWFDEMISAHQTQSRGRFMVANNEHVLARNEVGEIKSKANPYSGKESMAISCAVNTLTTKKPQSKMGTDPYQHEVLNVAIQFRFTDSKVRGSDMNKKIVGPLNNILHIDIPRYKREGRGKNKSVFGEMLLSTNDINKLGKMSCDVQTVCEQTGTDHHPLLDLINDLYTGTAHSTASKALRVQEYIANEGAQGAKALQRLLNLKGYVRTSTDSYDEAIKQADEIAIKYRRPIRRVGNKGARYLLHLNDRFKEVYEVIEEINETLRDLYDDNIMIKFDPDAFAKYQQSLFLALGSMLKTIDLNHLQPHDQVAVLRQVSNLPSHQMINVLKDSYPGSITDNFDYEDIEERFNDVRTLRNKITIEIGKIEKNNKRLQVDLADVEIHNTRLIRAQLKLDSIVNLSEVSTQKLTILRNYFDKEDRSRKKNPFKIRRSIHRELIGKINGVLESRRHKLVQQYEDNQRHTSQQSLNHDDNFTTNQTQVHITQNSQNNDNDNVLATVTRPSRLAHNAPMYPPPSSIREHNRVSRYNDNEHDSNEVEDVDPVL